MLVEGSKVYIGRLYEEARSMGAFRVTEEPRFYHGVRERVQRGLSTAAVEVRLTTTFEPGTVHARHVVEEAVEGAGV
jgi:hypothetical protein